ncbi:hypothetical protein [Nocardia sp. IFM 10818]
MPPPSNRPEASSNNGYGGHREQQNPPAAQPQTPPAAQQPPPTENERNRPDASSNNGVGGHNQQQQPTPAESPNPLGADVPTYNPTAPGLVPAAPAPERTLTGIDPSDNSRVQITIPQQQQTLGSDPYPASKTRLPDGPNGEPRYAILNGAREYLYTVDGNGDKIGSPDQELLTADLAGDLATQAEVGLAALALTALTRGALVGGATGAAGGGVGAAPGAAIGAAVNLAAVLATVALYEQSQKDRDEDESPPDRDERIDPNSLPDTGDPNAIVIPPSGVATQRTPPATTQNPSSDPNSTTLPGTSNPANDPNTVHQRILFPSAKPGQPGVPVEGTYWVGNSLVWAPGNPAGKKPGTYAKNPSTKTDLNLEAVLYKLLESGLDDIDEEEHRPPIMAALAVLQGTLLYRQIYHSAIVALGSSYGADITKLTSSNPAIKRTELERLADLGAPEVLLNDAIKAWWGAKAPVDRAKELLGEAGAIAMLRTDGWTVNPRPKGNYTHDIVAVKNGEVMVIEAKGGDPGPPRPGQATVSAGPGSDTDILAQQMTDPYLWHKLKEDAENDPAFKQWLVDQGVWTAIENEDPSTVGYRLIKVDTNGNIIVYGSQQNPVGEGIPAETVIGQTTGNGSGPTLRGIAQPIPQTDPIALMVNSPDGLLGQGGSWLGDLIQTGLHDITAIAQLAVPIPTVPALQPGLWPVLKPANESLTVNVMQQTPPAQPISDAERLNYMTYM